MEELCQPTMNGRGEPIAPVNIQATDFGLKNHMIQQVQNSCQFHTLLGDDANKHLDKFLTITQSMKQNGVTDDALRLYLFPYSLTHHATAWFNRLLKNYIHTFQETASKFLSKYFPPSMVTKLRNEINTFYNGLTLRHRDTINAADGGTFMKRRPKECYDLIENMTAHHNDWDTSAHRGESSSSTTSSSEIAALAQQMIKMRKDMLKIFKSPVATLRTFMLLRGALPSNTIPNPREEIKAITTRSGNVLAGPSVPLPPLSSSSKEVERDPKTITDQAHISSPECTTRVPPLVIQLSPIFRSSELPPSPSTSSVIPERNLHQPLILYPSRLNGEKLQDNLAEALALMPKYAKILKDLLSDKEKLLGLANISLTENCSAVLLKKLLKKLGDLGKFLIPCDFPKLEKCMALADLGVSINLMPLSVWKKLMLPELILTRMTLELANRSVAYLAGIAEDVCVQVGKFTFPADFVVVDYDIDPRVPLILRRPFLRTARALVDVYGEELILRVGDEKLILSWLINKLCRNILSKHGNEKSIQFHHFSGSTTSPSNSFPSLTSFKTSDSSLEEFADELALLEPIPPRNEDDNFDPEADLKEIKYLLNRDPSTDSSPKTNIDIIDPILERFTNELALVYSFPSKDDDDDRFDFEFDNEEWKKLLYGDLFDNTHSENEKDQDLKMECLIDDMDDYFLPLLPASDSTLPEESYKSSKIVALLSSPFENEDKVFNPGILILGGTHIFHDKSKDKDLKVNSSTEALLILEDSNFLSLSSDRELLFHLELSVTETLLSFSSENKTNFDPFIEIPSDESKVRPSQRFCRCCGEIGYQFLTAHSRCLVGPSFPPPSLSSSSKEVEREPEPTMDQVLPKSTIRVPPPVVQPSPTPRSSEIPLPPTSFSSEISKRNPHQPPVPYLSRLNKEKLQDKSDIQIHKFLQMFNTSSLELFSLK
ncbi:reverse transcriptase domain-containing protein [Tanacetum coccineum]